MIIKIITTTKNSVFALSLGLLEHQCMIWRGGKIKVNSQKAYTTVVLYRSRNLFGETCTSFFFLKV